MSTQLPVIEQATLHDAEAVARLHFLSHTVSFRGFASERWVNTRRNTSYVSNWRTILGSKANNDVTLVARFGEKTVGIVRVALSDSADYDAQLTSMHVDPELTGCGIGTLLMNRALEFIREQGFGRVELGVIAANADARRFYEAHGWKLVKELPDGIEGVPIAIYKLV